MLGQQMCAACSLVPRERHFIRDSTYSAALPSPTQTADAAGAGWESWMRAAWRRWNRTRDATKDSWDSVRDQAYRWDEREGGCGWL